MNATTDAHDHIRSCTREKYRDPNVGHHIDIDIDIDIDTEIDIYIDMDIHHFCIRSRASFIL